MCEPNQEFQLIFEILLWNKILFLFLLYPAWSSKCSIGYVIACDNFFKYYDQTGIHKKCIRNLHSINVSIPNKRLCAFKRCSFDSFLLWVILPKLWKSCSLVFIVNTICLYSQRELLVKMLPTLFLLLKLRTNLFSLIKIIIFLKRLARKNLLN